MEFLVCWSDSLSCRHATRRRCRCPLSTVATVEQRLGVVIQKFYPGYVASVRRCHHFWEICRVKYHGPMDFSDGQFSQICLLWILEKKILSNCLQKLGVADLNRFQNSLQTSEASAVNFWRWSFQSSIVTIFRNGNALRTHPGLLEYCYATPDVGCPCGEVFWKWRNDSHFPKCLVVNITESLSKVGDAHRRWLSGLSIWGDFP